MKSLHFLFPLVLSLKVATAATLGFDTLTDGESVTSQFYGINFQNAIVLSSGISLNEFEFPPFSGSNVISDNGGPITLDFASPITSFGGRFTYNYNVGCVGLGCGGVSVLFYDASNTLQFGAGSLFQSNLALSGDPGSSPNELVGSAFLSGFNITKVVISGDPAGGSFSLDDLTYGAAYSAVPEPNTGITFLAALGTLIGLKRNLKKTI